MVIKMSVRKAIIIEVSNNSTENVAHYTFMYRGRRCWLRHILSSRIPEKFEVGDEISFDSRRVFNYTVYSLIGGRKLTKKEEAK